MPIELTKEQQEAVNMAIENNISAITGSPGTGKTTVVKEILRSMGDMKKELGAPTGRASKRLREQTGERTKTIHKMLEKSDVNGRWVSRRTRNYPLDAELFIFDEFSMVDVELASELLDAIPQGSKVVIIGDHYQLPSVGSGNVLQDLMDSKIIPTTELTLVKRQEQGLIIENCDRIKKGENILRGSDSDDFVFIERNSPEAIQQAVLDLVRMHDAQVITAHGPRNDLGAKSLNTILQEAVNGDGKEIEGSPFRIGDRVIQLKNNYHLDIYNGDFGYIRETEQHEIVVEFDEPTRFVRLNPKNNNLDLGYAVTCHKYQGSEAPTVVIPIHSSFTPSITQRNWLYTAISRASKKCICVGQWSEVSKIISRVSQHNRSTLLKEFLNE